MTEQARIPAPNYTQIPNILFDLMADKDAGMTEAELRVLLAIARKTFGWHKKRDKISLSQLEQLTSMSRASVRSGIEAAERRGIIRRTPDTSDKRGGFYYELVVSDQSTELTSSKSEPVQNLNQSNPYTGSSSKFEPDLVQNLTPQKKEKEKKESVSAAPARAPLSELATAIADVCKVNPKLATPKQKSALNATYAALKAVGATPDEVRLRERWWYENDWRARQEKRPPRPAELQEIWESAVAVPVAQPRATNGKPAERPAPTTYAPPSRSIPASELATPEDIARVMRAGRPSARRPGEA